MAWKLFPASRIVEVDFTLTFQINGFTFPAMAKPPLILVSPSIERRGVEFHDLSASLSIKYDFAVTQSGGIPVTAPATTDRALLAEAVRRVDGVLLTGGDDINPDLYAKNLPRAVRKTVETTPDGGGRDLRELVLLDEVFRQRKPLLAICRGHQLLNIALGGELVADIRRQVPGALEPSAHGQGGRNDARSAVDSRLIAGQNHREADSGREQLASSGRIEPGGTADGGGADARRDCGSDGMEAGSGAADAIFDQRAISPRTADAKTRGAPCDFFRFHTRLRPQRRLMKKHILIVEDEADIRGVLADVLMANYRVSQAANGAALKVALEGAAPDLVMLDLNLGDANGLDLLPQIKKNWPDTEVVVLTGEATFEAAVEATKRGAYHFITKPFECRQAPGHGGAGAGEQTACARRPAHCAAR